jgi:hypothetical protein
MNSALVVKNVKYFTTSQKTNSLIKHILNVRTRRTKLMKKIIGTIVAVALAIIASFLWLKAEHRPQEAISQAQKFVDLVQTNKLVEAFQLTFKNERVGKTDLEFADIVKRQLCNVNTQTTTFPFQSNGNRLRRWFDGRPIEPPEITVEFSGSCLFGVSLRFVDANGWKVYFFQSHAG